MFRVRVLRFLSTGKRGPAGNAGESYPTHTFQKEPAYFRDRPFERSFERDSPTRPAFRRPDRENAPSRMSERGREYPTPYASRYPTSERRDRPDSSYDQRRSDFQSSSNSNWKEFSRPRFTSNSGEKHGSIKSDGGDVKYRQPRPADRHMERTPGFGEKYAKRRPEFAAPSEYSSRRRQVDFDRENGERRQESATYEHGDRRRREHSGKVEEFGERENRHSRTNGSDSYATNQGFVRDAANETRKGAGFYRKPGRELAEEIPRFTKSSNGYNKNIKPVYSQEETKGGTVDRLSNDISKHAAPKPPKAERADEEYEETALGRNKKISMENETIKIVEQTALDEAEELFLAKTGKMSLGRNGKNLRKKKQVKYAEKQKESLQKNDGLDLDKDDEAEVDCSGKEERGFN